VVETSPEIVDSRSDDRQPAAVVRCGRSPRLVDPGGGAERGESVVGDRVDPIAELAEIGREFPAASAAPHQQFAGARYEIVAPTVGSAVLLEDGMVIGATEAKGAHGGASRALAVTREPGTGVGVRVER
jgi:hypothetical protein